MTSTSSSRAAAISSGESDSLIDDFESRVASGDRDLFGAVGVTVESGLATRSFGGRPR